MLLHVGINMKVIPLIYFEKRKIYSEKDGEPISLKDLLTIIDKDNELYIFDKDGLEQNKMHY